jgi:gamma-glutamylputrescine oxidase
LSQSGLCGPSRADAGYGKPAKQHLLSRFETLLNPAMSLDNTSLHAWGESPWEIDFSPPAQALPHHTDFAIIGGGFTGLSAAAWLRLLAPEKSVVVLEAGRIGAGASGRTGGLVLAETAVGDLPGLGDVLTGFQGVLVSLGVECGLTLSGVWEIGRNGSISGSPISWNDSGTLHVVAEVPGGTLDPGKLVSGLARAGHRLGVTILEKRRVTGVRWNHNLEIEIAASLGDSVPIRMSAGKILLSTNGLSVSLSGFAADPHPKLTLAALTAPLREDQIAAIGLSEEKPFYTTDFPYLWGRSRPDCSIIWGGGLVDPPPSGNLEELSMESEAPTRLFQKLERRVRGLHPALAQVEFTNRWGGPIFFRDDWKPVFDWHPHSPNAIVLGAFAGHGVALSNYLGAWAAEVLLNRRALPEWGKFCR